jgi:hypothetical protein
VVFICSCFSSALVSAAMRSGIAMSLDGTRRGVMTPHTTNAHSVRTLGRSSTV